MDARNRGTEKITEQRTNAYILEHPVNTPIDLGLSVKWANGYVGASSPVDYGDLFAWGEVETKDQLDYDWRHYKYGWTEIESYGVIKYYGEEVCDGKTILEPEDDAATVNWGGTWRMPTANECQELIDKCEWVWYKLNGVAGWKVIGPNGNAIFLRFRDVGKMVGGPECDFWSSSLYAYDEKDAYYILGMGGIQPSLRSDGHFVRPVCP